MNTTPTMHNPICFARYILFIPTCRFTFFLFYVALLPNRALILTLHSISLLFKCRMEFRVKRLSDGFTDKGNGD